MNLTNHLSGIEGSSSFKDNRKENKAEGSKEKLSPWQAASVLGCSPLTVFRETACGRIPHTFEPTLTYRRDHLEALKTMRDAPHIGWSSCRKLYRLFTPNQAA